MARTVCLFMSVLDSTDFFVQLHILQRERQTHTHTLRERKELDTLYYETSLVTGFEYTLVNPTNTVPVSRKPTILMGK